MTALSECVSHMKETQKPICYITGKNKEQVANSVMWSMCKTGAFEVVYKTDPTDKHCMQQLNGLDGNSLISMTT